MELALLRKTLTFRNMINGVQVIYIYYDSNARTHASQGNHRVPRSPRSREPSHL
jgi:hypothetical protein